MPPINLLYRKTKYLVVYFFVGEYRGCLARHIEPARFYRGLINARFNKYAFEIVNQVSDAISKRLPTFHGDAS
jgi:hypothetical protein